MRRGLGFHARHSPGGFNPASLFTGGVNGAWYDPSDLTTLFTDRAGTTPCGTPGGGSVVPVGLMLDKSQGLVLGSELVSGTWANGTAFPFDTFTASGTGFTGNKTAFGISQAVLPAGASIASGAFYRVEVRVTFADDEDITVSFQNASGGGGLASSSSFSFGNVSSATTIVGYVRGTSTGTAYLQMSQQGTNRTLTVASVSVKLIAGNHAIAANDTTARPELRARVNLLTYSTLQGGGAAPTGWTQPVATGTSAPSGTAANGDIIYTQSATAQRPFLQQSVVLTANVQYRLSFTITAATGLLYQDIIGLNTVEPISYFLNGVSVSSTATVSPGTVSITWTSAGGTTGLRIGTGVFGNATGSLTFSSPDLRPANIGTAMPAYQRIVDANTYDAVGFPRYFVANGTSSAMSTPGNVNLSGTDKVTVFAGVRKLSDAAQGVVAELSATIASNNGAFLLAAPNSAAANYNFSSKGTTQVNNTVTTFTAPITNVLTGQADIAAPSNVIRVNGAPTTVTSTQGTGNFDTYPLFIGSRNNASFFLTGNIYSLIVVGSAVSAGQISATEQWVAGKVGITI